MKRYLFALFVFAVIYSAAPRLGYSQWTQPTNTTPQFITCFAVSGPYLFAGTGTGVYVTKDTGATWQDVSTSMLENTYVLSIAASEGNIFVGAYGGDIYLTTDNGTTWAKVNNGLPQNPGVIYSLVVMGTNVYAATFGKGVFVTTNNGANWSAINNGLSDTLIHSLAVMGTTLFAGTYNSGRVFRTTNNGALWEPVNNGLPNSVNIVTFLVNGTDIYAGAIDTGRGVYRSTDQGLHWDSVNNGLTYANPYAFAVRGSNIFVGTTNNLYRTTNNGGNWMVADDGLPQGTFVYALAILGPRMFTGTTVSGIWRRPLADFGISDVDEQQWNVPKELELAQNYPNPLIGVTNIEYSLSQSGFVTLTVYNALGKEVATLVNESRSAGEHRVIFNGEGLRNGVYYCRLSSGGKIDTREIIIAR